MNALIRGWNIMRVLRLLMGIAAIWQAVVMKETLLGIAGIVLLLMSLLNTGCCGAGICSVPAIKQKKQENNNSTHETVDN